MKYCKYPNCSEADSDRISLDFLFSCIKDFLRNAELLAFTASDSEADDLTCGGGDALSVVLELCDSLVVFSQDSFELTPELGIGVVE